MHIHGPCPRGSSSTHPRKSFWAPPPHSHHATQHCMNVNSVSPHSYTTRLKPSQKKRNPETQRFCTSLPSIKSGFRNPSQIRTEIQGRNKRGRLVPASCSGLGRSNRLSAASSGGSERSNRPLSPEEVQSSAPTPQIEPPSEQAYGRKGRARRLLPGVPKAPPPGPRVQGSGLSMRVYAASDLHTDYPQNMAWVEGLSPEDYLSDVLIVAGDVADCLQTFRATLRTLRRKFSHVFFVPGNHDLWCRRIDDPPTSQEKLTAVLRCCEEEGVETAPRRMGDVWIVPIYSWHHQSFDKERDIEGFRIPPLSKACMDYRACKWPEPLRNEDESLALHFDAMNECHLDPFQKDPPSLPCQLISFSHFLPRMELCPEKRMLFYPHLPKVVGSDWLEARVRSLHGPRGGPTACHVFGHTHFSWDATLDGIRYIQAPLAYPRERQRRVNGGQDWLPLMLYDSNRGGLIGGPLKCHWSDYYRENGRDPENTTFAPWVADLYKPIANK